MNPQSQEEFIESLEDIIESREGIIEDMRAILVQKGDDSEILHEARTALSDWFIATYPHLYPRQGRPQLRVIRGPYPHRYLADRACPECAMLLPVEVVVDSPKVIGYRCGQGHKWLVSA